MTTWSEEHIAQLKSLWGQGDSASIIASKLPGNFSRNAVLGKVHRMEIQSGIRRQPTQRKEPEPTGTRPERRVKRCAVAPVGGEAPHRRTPSLAVVPMRISTPRPRRLPPPPPIVFEEPVPTGKVTIMELSDKTCRWPIGEVGKEGFHYCGSSKDADAPTPYCPYHAQKAVAAVQPKPYSASAFRSKANVR